MLHLICLPPADLLSIHMGINVTASEVIASIQPAAAVGDILSKPPTYRSARRNLEMPPLLHVPQSTRPQPFPAPPWLHT